MTASACEWSIHDSPLPSAILAASGGSVQHNAAWSSLPVELRERILRSLPSAPAVFSHEGFSLAVQQLSGGKRRLVQVLSSPAPKPSSQFVGRLVALGALSQAVRDYDWAGTVLGPLESWSPTLQAVTYSTLTARQPVAFWVRAGEAREVLMIPNAPFQKQLSALDLMGTGVRTAFPDRFDALVGLHDRVEATGQPVGAEEEAWTFWDLNGRLAESYWDYEWLPIYSPEGEFVCTQNRAVNITNQVHTRKGLETLSQVREATAACQTVEAFCAAFTKSLSDTCSYLPFCLLYTSDDLTIDHGPDSPRSICLTLRASLHVPEDHDNAPRLVQIRPSSSSNSPIDGISLLSDMITGSEELPWGIEDVVRDQVPLVLQKMTASTAGMGTDGKGVDTVLVCPISVDDGAIKGFLVFGLSDLRPFEGGYADWTRLLAQHVNDGIARAWATEQAELQASRAQDLERLRGAFYKTISDEVKTPVSLILSSLSDVLESQQELNHVSKNSLRRASRSSLKLLNLFDSLLDYFRLQAGQWIPTFQLTSLEILTSEIVHQLVGNIRDQRSRIELDCAPTQAYVDPDIFEKLLLLTIGSLVRTAKRLEEDTIKIELSETEQGARLTVTVIRRRAQHEVVGSPLMSEPNSETEPAIHSSFDTLGLARHLQSSFARLLRGRSHTNDDMTRTVLELPTRDVASLDGGRVMEEPVARTVAPRPAYTYAAVVAAEDSHPSTGSELSAETRLTSHHPEIDSMFFQGPLSVRSSVVLLAIRDHETRSYCREALASSFDVKETDNGQSLLELTASAAPNLLVLDAALPGMDSYALIVALRENAIETPVVLLTTRAGGEVRADSLIAGAGELLVKPFSTRELLIKTCSQLQLAKMKDELQTSLAARTAALEETRTRAAELDQQLQSIVRHAPIGLFMLTSNGKHLYQNATWHDLTGVPRDAPADSWPDQLVEEDRGRVTGIVALTIAEGGSCTSLAVSWRNGNKTLVAVRAWRNAEGGVHFVGSVVDVTELRQLEAAWAKASQERVLEAQRMQRLQEQSVDVFSHESRSPLSAVMQATELLTEELQAIADNAEPALQEKLSFCQDLLSSIRSCATHQKRIADDVLNFSKLNMQLLALDRKATDVLALIDHVLKMFEPELRTASLNVERVVDGSMEQHGGRFVVADPHRLQQVIINFLTNAIRYSADASKRHMQVYARSSPTAPPAREGVLRIVPTGGLQDAPPTHVWTTIGVRDYGRGLSAAQQAQLFERFSQVRPNVDGFSGSGLGLLIAKSIVQLHGGFVEVDSTLGESTSFSFTIPAERTTKELTSRSSFSQSGPMVKRRSLIPGSPGARLLPGTPSRSRSLGKRNTVLVVDDSSINVKLLRKQLEKRGYDVETGSNGQEALDLIDALRNDILGICLDVEMPIMNGLQAVAELRKREEAAQLRRLLVIAVTGNARTEQADTCKRAGYDDVITKPYNIEQLQELLEQARVK